MEIYLAVLVLCAITSPGCCATLGDRRWEVVDENGDKVQEISRFAVQDKDQQLGNSQYQSKDIKVMEAYSFQVVLQVLVLLIQLINPMW